MDPDGNEEGFLTSSPLHASADRERKGFSPTLPPQAGERRLTRRDYESGDDYYEDDARALIACMQSRSNYYVHVYVWRE